MYIVTGGAGFIGSALVWQLNQMGHDDIIIVDNLGHSEKWKNLRALKFQDYVEKDFFLQKFVENGRVSTEISAIIHMGACSSTTEKDASYLIHNNFEYTKALSLYCAARSVRFIYASSAATYGNGEMGYVDGHDAIEKLRPLNMYGYSKQLFDLWARNKGLLAQQVGLKFFNVYGPNEYHKDDMRSVVHKAFGQIMETGKVRLFKSYHPDYQDGEQMRDFIYIKDAVAMTLSFLEKPHLGGLFNVGTGKARTWQDLVSATFTALGKKINIEYIEMPESLRPKYQYFTQADMQRMKLASLENNQYPLEQGINDYVKQYLVKDYFLGDEKD